MGQTFRHQTELKLYLPDKLGSRSFCEGNHGATNNSILNVEDVGKLHETCMCPVRYHLREYLL